MYDNLELESPLEQLKTLRGSQLRCINTGGWAKRDIAVYNDKTCVYYADIFEYKWSTPDIILYRGSIEGPTAGTSHIRWNKCCPKLGVGADEKSMSWVELRRTGFWSKTQRFSWKGRRYSMMRLSKEERDTLSGVSKIFRAPHFKVIDEDSGELLALHVAQSCFPRPKRTRVTFAEVVSAELEILILLGIMTWRELVRRE